MVVLHIPCLKGLQQKHHKKTTKQAKEAVVLVKRSKSNCAMVNKSPGTGSKSNRDNSQPDVAAVLFFFPGSFPSKRKDAFFFPCYFLIITIFNWKYIYSCIYGGFLHCHVSFRGGNIFDQHKSASHPNLKTLFPLVGTVWRSSPANWLPKKNTPVGWVCLFVERREAGISAI